MENMEPSSPKTPKEERSPATSTPGHHLFSGIDEPSVTLGTPATIRRSELLYSDENTVLSSTMEESSVVVYEKGAEDTTIVDCSQGNSPVANRTRSHSVSLAPSSMT